MHAFRSLPALLRLAFGLCVAGMVLCQALSFQAEHAGWFKLSGHVQEGLCVEQHEQDHAADSSEVPHVHIHVHDVLALSDHAVVVPLFRRAAASMAVSDETCPDGPSRGVDYPPRLS